ncbi:recombination regulator RecX [Legionella sp. MW5194]|uniref:recombination regulator RecX n=1 Tax=Legionella sp. MW5194 TaxID=2662448 RepID=UPI00193D11BF|nr:recombination regulator RecX [Legionella sp. MW5194]QRN04340.1 recombination regulator RecX [Legionella sp. MW5194]
MTKAFDCALRLLARREHSAQELVGKLIQKAYSREEAEEALRVCQHRQLQSDARFSEHLCRTRINQGYGPLRIRQELEAQRVSEDIIAQVLAEEEGNWPDHAQAVWLKKFKAQRPASLAELKKQQRFLLYRGFPGDMIARVFKDNLNVVRA